MSSSKKQPRNKRKTPQNTMNHIHPIQQERLPVEDAEMQFLDYASQDPEQLIEGGLQPGLGNRDLDRLGPQYHATQNPGQAIARAADFPYPSNAFPSPSQPAFPTTFANYPGLQPSNTPAGAVAVTWQTTNSSVYSSESPAAASTASSAGAYGYASQQTTPSTYVGDYVSPTALQHAPRPGFNVYAWSGSGDGAVRVGGASSGTAASPVLQSYEMVTTTQDGPYSDSDRGMYVEVNGWQQGQQHQLAPPDEVGIKAEPPRHKRAKKSVDEESISSSITALSPGASKVTSTGGTSTGTTSTNTTTSSASTATPSRTKLRSASRASKNTQNRPDETPQERKSRNSHNLVEKQYRNRLNQQFEILMNTLPESMRSPTASSFGGTGASPSGGDSDGGGGGNCGTIGSVSAAHHGAFDVGERRLSKAQVLDMSARYIRSLERERDKLEEEKEELLESVRRLTEEQRGGDG